MSVVLWVLQGVLAVAFLMAGAMKLMRGREQLRESMGWVEDFSARTIKVIGLLEVLAAIGLVLPGLTGILPVLTPLAALGLVGLMLGAAVTHYRRHEPPMIAINAALGIVAAVVAWGRFGPWPL